MFYGINLDVRQSRQANDNATVVKHAKEKDFAIATSTRKRSCHGLKHIVRFLKDADRWQSHSPVR